MKVRYLFYFGLLWYQSKILSILKMAEYCMPHMSYCMKLFNNADQTCTCICVSATILLLFQQSLDVLNTWCMELWMSSDCLILCEMLRVLTVTGRFCVFFALSTRDCKAIGNVQPPISNWRIVWIALLLAHIKCFVYRQVVG